MTEQKLPDGYVNLGPVSVHVDDMRDHTANIDRFLEYLPMALELVSIDAGDPEARNVWSAAENRLYLAMTVDELAGFVHKLAYTGQLLQASPVEIH